MRENSKVKITIRPVPYASLRKHGLLEMHDPGGRSRRSPQNTICLYSPERLIFPKGCPMGMNSTANTSWKKSLRCSICSIRKDIAAAACQWVMLWNWGQHYLCAVFGFRRIPFQPSDSLRAAAAQDFAG